MEGFVKGDVVVVPFPFTDMTCSKKRPAIVLASFNDGSVILAQITSQAWIDDYSVIINKNDFEHGTLKVTSIARPNKIFTADKSLILYKAGAIKHKKMAEVKKRLKKIFLEE